MRSFAAALVALFLAAGLAGPVLAHVHGDGEALGFAALDEGDAAGAPVGGESCSLCTVRAPVRNLAGPSATTLLGPAREPFAPRSTRLLRAPRSPLRDAAPARAPPGRA